MKKVFLLFTGLDGVKVNLLIFIFNYLEIYKQTYKSIINKSIIDIKKTANSAVFLCNDI